MSLVQPSGIVSGTLFGTSSLETLNHSRFWFRSELTLSPSLFRSVYCRFDLQLFGSRNSPNRASERNHKQHPEPGCLLGSWLGYNWFTRTRFHQDGSQIGLTVDGVAKTGFSVNTTTFDTYYIFLDVKGGNTLQIQNLSVVRTPSITFAPTPSNLSVHREILFPRASQLRAEHHRWNRDSLGSLCE